MQGQTALPTTTTPSGRSRAITFNSNLMALTQYYGEGLRGLALLPRRRPLPVPLLALPAPLVHPVHLEHRTQVRLVVVGVAVSIAVVAIFVLLVQEVDVVEGGCPSGEGGRNEAGERRSRSEGFCFVRLRENGCVRNLLCARKELVFNSGQTHAT